MKAIINGKEYELESFSIVTVGGDAYAESARVVEELSGLAGWKSTQKVDFDPAAPMRQGNYTLTHFKHHYAARNALRDLRDRLQKEQAPQ